jgi:hypothetical protein
VPDTLQPERPTRRQWAVIVALLPGSSLSLDSCSSLSRSAALGGTMEVAVMGGSLTYVTQIPIRSSFDIDRVRQQVLQAQNLSAAHWSAGQRACRPKQEVGDGTLEDVSHLHILSATKAFTLRAGLGTRLDAVLASALAVGLPSAARAPSAESAVC